MIYLAFVVIAALFAVTYLFLYQVMLQNGRLLQRIDAMEVLPMAATATFGGESPLETSGLPMGVIAPEFALPDLSGVIRSLAEWRGQRVLLTFFDPGCGFCLQMLPALASLQDDESFGRPAPVIVSSGGLDENRELFQRHEIDFPVLVQAEREVAAAYQVDGTPMAYMIAEDGTVASNLAVGVQAILVKAGEVQPEVPAAFTAFEAIGPMSTSEGVRTTPSKLVRDGLPQGATAPVFRLPKLGGGELSLLEYRGRSVLVVFSDPDCEPCNLMAPGLEQKKRDSALDVIMVSRGDPEANRLKAAELGLTFPVALQRSWEVSREYGMFATPIAFLVDEWGIIAEKVAVGPEAILALADKAATKKTIR